MCVYVCVCACVCVRVCACACVCSAFSLHNEGEILIFDEGNMREYEGKEVKGNRKEGKEASGCKSRRVS